MEHQERSLELRDHVVHAGGVNSHLHVAVRPAGPLPTARQPVAGRQADLVHGRHVGVEPGTQNRLKQGFRILKNQLVHWKRRS